MASVTQLQRSTPEAEGIASTAVLNFVTSVEQHSHPLDAVQGFMLLRHGKVVAEGSWAPYEPQSAHTLYSLSKSFTSSAIGLAVAEGLLTVDEPVLKFFPDDAPANPSANLQAMRVRHLLSMNTGHKDDTTRDVFGSADGNWPRTFLSLPVEEQPGSWFVYNTGATYMLSAIITKLTGQSLLDYLRPRLFEPLGIENPTWETDPRGISVGGTGLHIQLDGIARFGQMYLQQGMWQGQRILSEEWIAQATRATSDNSNTQTNPDWIVGYGYQFWRCQHNCYRGDGAFGQYCIVMPEQQVVLAIISGLRDMQVVLNHVWEHLLPALQPEALPANPPAVRQLREKLASLSLPLPAGQLSSPLAAQCSGNTYLLEQNDLQLQSVAITFAEKQSTLMVHDNNGQHTLAVGAASWLKSSANMRGKGAESVAASGAWTSEDTYTIHVCYDESEVCLVLRCQYTSGELHLEVEPNVSWVSTEVMTITGSLAG